MPIEFVIINVVPTNINKQSAILHLNNTDVVEGYRAYELRLAQSVNANDYINGLPQPTLLAFWNQGVVIDQAVYDASRLTVELAPFYNIIVTHAFSTLQSDTLDNVHSQVLTLLTNHTDIQAQLVAISSNLGLSSNTPQQKREQLLWVLVLSLINLVNEKR